METEPHANKVDAIYELREAVEVKAYAEQRLEATGSDEARDALLSAQLDVEAKTQDAIEICHDCGQAHSATEDHLQRSRVHSRHDNVITVDFRRDDAELA